MWGGVERGLAPITSASPLSPQALPKSVPASCMHARVTWEAQGPLRRRGLAICIAAPCDLHWGTFYSEGLHLRVCLYSHSHFN